MAAEVAVTCPECGVPGVDDPDAGVAFGVCLDCFEERLTTIHALVVSGLITDRAGLEAALDSAGVKRETYRGLLEELLP